jgi:hypothetical protein
MTRHALDNVGRLTTLDDPATGVRQDNGSGALPVVTVRSFIRGGRGDAFSELRILVLVCG